MKIGNRMRLQGTETLHQGWSRLTRGTFDYQRSDGSWQVVSRDVFDCGHGATALPYDAKRRKVILVRQFRYAAYTAGYDQSLIETPAGLLDDASPEQRIRTETEEETGYRISSVEKVFEAFMSPGAVSQKIHCYVAAYTPQDRVSDGGGLAEEGEDIEVLELDFDEAYAMIGDGRIQDGKTIMLLQYAAINLFSGPARANQVV
ncbi:NUDIX domain-containing protein [Hoeflea poritis]|uniref:GDP-mannose pyrophosphatase n=1 Tax=Hoeflea poritis TaxID=2993659 RepID=A0ABT4VHI6_9HYPH|nr:NUDIX domain-containing protein [Hoeflea poritis]MDA4844160.1 NUDIX domain-containing protein [Hoeflea poritis]